jgi:hypothetical protein
MGTWRSKVLEMWNLKVISPRSHKGEYGTKSEATIVKKTGNIHTSLEYTQFQNAVFEIFTH